MRDEPSGTPAHPDRSGAAGAERGAGRGARDRDVSGREGAASGAGARGAGSERRTDAVAWTALVVAVALTVWQAVYAYSAGAPGGADETYTAVNRFVSLILSLVAAVLGVVSLAQRRHPTWPALAGLAIGLNGFIVSVTAWLGGVAV
ncbi:hypothetical protein [Georgenia muralis]|uniref:Uncharacterized protein n=1 Tax=Georgenia muralis TaxID=154117 RepID=A0A3N5AB09_9MICO|nr:hypothetical protein [Georgenia muralis]RPF28821.1 hypothetical protein EDD32_3367 [Georgenia muralis]